MALSNAETAARLIATGGPAARRLAKQIERDAPDLAYDWQGWWGRPEQQIPLGDWVVWLLSAGRGFGKTRTGAEAVRTIVNSGQVEHLAFVAKTPADARDVMVNGPAGIKACTPRDEWPLWEPSKRSLTWPNGAQAIIYSGENPEQLRGPQHQLVWVDELCAFQYPKETWDNVAFGLRLPWRDEGPARAIVTTTAKPIPAFRALLKLRNLVITRGSTYDNAGNLAESFFEQMRDAYEGTTLGRQELYSELLEVTDGALWTRARIDALRVPTRPEFLERIVVAVDPAGSSGSNASEVGILVVGIGYDSHLYVLADRSGRMAPAVWAARAVEALYEFGADCIVAEKNHGGDMVEHTIRTADPDVKIITVTASRGKRVRAEPVSALYEQGRAHHVGTFAELEDQLVSWTGAPGERSPDRMDALVWAAFELIVKEMAQAVHWA